MGFLSGLFEGLSQTNGGKPGQYADDDDNEPGTGLGAFVGGFLGAIGQTLANQSYDDEDDD